MSDLAKDILNVLEQRVEDLKLRDLIDAVSDFAFHPEGRRVRRAIEELRAAGNPIGSSARRGYFLIRTRKDWEDAVKEFRAKAMACLKMKAQLERIGTDLFTKQGTLDNMSRKDLVKGLQNGMERHVPAKYLYPKGNDNGSESAGD